MITVNLSGTEYDTKHNDLQTIESLYEEASEQPYDLSMPMIEASIIGNFDKYKKISHTFLTTLHLNQLLDDPNTMVAQLIEQVNANAQDTGIKLSIFFQTWIIGRYLISNPVFPGDSPKAEKLAQLCRTLLSETQQSALDLKEQPFYTWTWGYLAAYYAAAQEPNNYQQG